MKIGVDVSKIKTAGCVKPKCKRFGIHRHHRAHEYMWVMLWTRGKVGDEKFQKFAKRYWSFDKRDTIDICSWHHAEIHIEYDKIIQTDVREKRKPLTLYTWEEAEVLMRKLRAFCDQWIKKETEGSNPKLRLGKYDNRNH